MHSLPRRHLPGTSSARARPAWPRHSALWGCSTLRQWLGAPCSTASLPTASTLPPHHNPRRLHRRRAAAPGLRGQRAVKKTTERERGHRRGQRRHSTWRRPWRAARRSSLFCTLDLARPSPAKMSLFVNSSESFVCGRYFFPQCFPLPLQERPSPVATRCWSRRRR